jgi:hypothetical protein
VAFEDILKQISDETERAQFGALAEKYGPVKEYMTLGEQVKPVFERLTAAGLPAAAEIARAADWAEYRDKHWLGDRKMWDSQAAAVDEAETLKARVAELEGKVGTEMTAEDIKALLAAEGVVRKTDLAGVIDGKGLQGAMQLQAKRFEEVNSLLESKQFEHYEKFKQPLPRAEIYAYMEKAGERDVLKAYAEVIKPLEHSAEVARLKAENAAAKEAGKQEGIAEAQARVNAQRMPVDGGSGTRTGAGHFMSRIFSKRQTAQTAGNGKLGTGSSAAAGFADYQKAKMGQAAV